jgi:hypothetical protein
LTELVYAMSPSTQEWMIAVLNDINHAQSHPNVNTDEMFGWYSFLDVGPLRTTCSGCVDCGSLSQAFAIIKEDVMSSLRNSSKDEDDCFPDLLVPLDHVAFPPSTLTVEGGPLPRFGRRS